MDIMYELTDKFSLTLDSALANDTAYKNASSALNRFCEKKLSAEQTSEINELVGILSSAIFHSLAKAGMKLGARIAVGLLTEDGDNSV